MPQPLRWDGLGHRIDGVQPLTHGLVDRLEVPFNGCARNTQVPDNTGVLVQVKLVVNLQLGRLVFIFKNLLGDTDQVCHDGDHLVGAVLVSDFSTAPGGEVSFDGYTDCPLFPSI